VFANVLQDVQLAVRSWARAPMFTLLAVSMLGLGMGGTLAVFSVVSAVLMEPLDYPDPDRLVHIEGQRVARHGITYLVYEEVAQRARSLEAVTAWQGWRIVLRDAEGVPQTRSAASVSANFFDVLRAGPSVGRLFGPEDHPLGHAPVVVLSHAFWREQYASDANVIGRSIRVDSISYTIVGVAPAGFVDPVATAIPTNEPVLWRSRPEMFTSAERPDWVGFWAFGRLRAGVTLRQARGEIRQIARELYPGAPQPVDVGVATLRDRLVRDVRPTLLLLFAAVGGVFLIACANLTNLLLSRGTARARDVAVRASLGAGRPRLVAQLLTETLVLCMLGAVVGLGVAWAGGRAIVALAASGLPRASGVTLDVRVLLLALLLSFLCALAAGLAPALRMTDARVALALRDAGRSTLPARRGQRLRHSLVILETALAVMLLSGGGVLLRSAWNLMRVDPGFDATPVLTLRASFFSEAFPTASSQDVALANVVERVAALQGALAVGAISDLPMSGATNSTSIQRSDNPSERGLQTLVRAVTAETFTALRIPTLRGRTFESTDGPGAAQVAVVNARFAESLFADQDPIGRTVDVRGVTRQIVGVVADVKEFTLAGGPDPVLYVPYVQETQPWMREQMTLVIHTTGDPAVMAEQVTTAVRSAEPLVTLSAIRPMSAYIDRDVAAPRLRAILIGVFAVLALALAAAGTGGLMAYTVSQRLPEMGLRMALGATRGAILELVFRGAARLTIAGILLGLLGAFASLRLVARFLFGVPPIDIPVLVAASALLAIVGTLASWLPALRASRTDPATTLRAE
jgi:predicted permease